MSWCFGSSLQSLYKLLKSSGACRPSGAKKPASSKSQEPAQLAVKESPKPAEAWLQLATWTPHKRPKGASGKLTLNSEVKNLVYLVYFESYAL